METTYFRLTMPNGKKSNGKTGAIPVSTTSSHTCWHGCAAFDACYGKSGPLQFIWHQTDQGKFSTNLEDFVSKVAALPENQVWRHNQAGDLPGVGAAINKTALNLIVEANSGKRGFTYTHKPVLGDDNVENRDAVAAANKAGFAINLSANNLAHADRLADLGIAPVTVLLPHDHAEKTVKTPAGRTVVTCPATYRDDTQCANCGGGAPLCQRVDRDYVIGFPGHGAKKAAITTIAQGE